MSAPRSLITHDVDLEREGMQTGVLRIPYSHDRSAYGYLPIPIVVARRGEGPTVLLTGGVHGDEYEGPIGLGHLVRTLPLDRLAGRLIVIPAVNFPAYRAGTRVSPIDKLNLNRVFPGERNGSPTAMIAHYLESELLPLADYALDFHAGGSSLDYLPVLFSLPPRDEAERARLEGLIAAFAPPLLATMDLLGEDRVFRAAARRAGVTFFDGEFGGRGGVNLDGLRVVREGLAGVLDHLGVLPRSEPAPISLPPRRLVVRGAGHHMFAPVPGIFEPCFRLGDELEAGSLAALIHDPLQPWSEPTPVHVRESGLALCIRNYALVEAGDCLGHLASDA